MGLTSSYETTDGATHAAADVWFVADKHAAPSTTVVEEAAAGLTPATVAEPAALSFQLDLPGNTQKQLVVDEATPQDLRTRVSGLAQVLGSFADGASGTPDAVSALFKLDSAPGATGLGAASLAVSSMVDTMRQFDANGQLMGSQAQQVVANNPAKPKIAGLDDAGKGFLATGGQG